MTRALAFFVVLTLAAQAAGFRTALPGYRYQFPSDHFAHPEFRTEWWYWTGNLFDPAGRRFGFELTFFRRAVTPEPVTPAGPWDITDLYLAHLTLSDVEGRRFLHNERLNRAGPGLAGADFSSGRIWNGNWSGELDRLHAVTDRFRLDLRLTSRKPPVIHGINGVSPKAAGEGRASHYISFTRLEASGALTLEGRDFKVSGTAWMDHEFFTHQLEPDQVGWDWLSIQLDDGTELMLFRLRRRDGSADPFSAGTYVDSRGAARHLTARDFRIDPVPGSEWRSPITGARYPLRWRIAVPKLDLRLEASTPLESQELTTQDGVSPSYWEGAMDYAGTRGERPARGIGYLEMTGYDRPVSPGL
jgi:predicted secreted hydrolase